MSVLRLIFLAAAFLTCVAATAATDTAYIVKDTAYYTGLSQTPVVRTDTDILAATWAFYDVDSNSISKIVDAGTYFVTATITSDTLRDAVVSDTFIVLPAPLRIKPEDTSEIAGKIMESYAYTYRGFVNGETQTVLSVLEEPRLISNASMPLELGVYEVRVAAPGMISSKNYALANTHDTGLLTVSARYQAVVFQKTPRSVNLPTTTTSATNVTLEVRGEDGVPFPAGTHVHLDVSGTGKGNVKLTRTYFNLSNKTADSMIIAIVTSDTKATNGATLNLKLYVTPGVKATAHDGVDIALLNTSAARLTASNYNRIGFYAGSSKANITDYAIIRIDNNALTSGQTAELTFEPAKGLTLYKSDGTPLIDNRLAVATNGVYAILAKTDEIYDIFTQVRKKVTLKSAIIDNTKTKLQLAKNTHTVSFVSSQPYFAEIPNSAILTRPTYQPDSFLIDPLAYARTFDKRQKPELLRVAFDTAMTLDTTVSGFGAYVRISPPSSFFYDFSHLNFTDSQLTHGFTDSFPFYLAENGAGTSQATFYVAYGRPTATGDTFHVFRDSFNTFIADHSDSTFEKKPAMSALYYRPFTRMTRNNSWKPKRLTMKIDYAKGSDSVIATLTRFVRAYHPKNIKNARAFKGGARYFLDFSPDSPQIQRPGVGLTLNMRSTVGKRKAATDLSTVILAAPLVDEVLLAVDNTDSEKPIDVLLIRGKRFGLAPKVMLEYKTPARRPAVKVRKVPLFWSPKTGDARTVTIVDSTAQVKLPTLAEFKAQNPTEMVLAVRLPKRLPKNDGLRIDLLIDSKSLIGGQKNVQLSLPATLWTTTP